ncbi:MAG TPA: hypothetical protein VGB15_07575 [Longimicrobium sp.]
MPFTAAAMRRKGTSCCCGAHASRPRWRDRAAASALVREAVAHGYAYDGTTHAGPEFGPLFP